MINSFRGRWYFLSNFSPCEIEHKGIKYPSVEHFYVAMKVTEIQLLNGVHYTADDFRELICKVKLPSDVKKIGQRLKVRKDWEERKLGFMEYAINEKFKDENLSNLLLQTGEMSITENNWWHDNFWGSCLCPKCGNKGENHLGNLLMKKREEIKKQNTRTSLEEEIKNKLNNK